MIWLFQPPDLSPCKLVLDELNKRVQREYPKSENELFQCCKNLWNGLLSTFFQKVSERLLRIFKAVIKEGTIYQPLRSGRI